MDSFRKLRNKTTNLEATLEVIIAINGTSISDHELESIVDRGLRVKIIQENIGGDANINEAFFYAMENSPDYLWILSANDEIKNQTLEKIFKCCISRSDLVVFARNDKEEIITPTSVFEKEYEAVPFGLISSVIYDVNQMRGYFPQGLRFHWTGWGQLAVIETALRFGKIKVLTFPESEIFANQTNVDAAKNRETVARTYNHSFFGMPLVIRGLYADSPARAKQLQKQWISGNWFKIHNFNIRKNTWANQAEITNAWIQDISLTHLRSLDLKSKFLVVTGNSIPWENFANVELLRKIIKT